jgi:hypothetical protein
VRDHLHMVIDWRSIISPNFDSGNTMSKIKPEGGWTHANRGNLEMVNFQCRIASLMHFGEDFPKKSKVARA